MDKHGDVHTGRHDRSGRDSDDGDVLGADDLPPSAAAGRMIRTTHRPNGPEPGINVRSDRERGRCWTLKEGSCSCSPN